MSWNYKPNAENVIVANIVGRRKRTTVKWVIGCLKEMIEHNKISPNEISEIISKIERQPSLYLLDRFPERGERLKILKIRLKEEEMI